GTDISWAAPTDSSRRGWDREDPNENYNTLAEVLQIAFEHSQPGSELRKKAGLSLAKLSLLKGDWTGMNEYLVALGQKPIPNERRATLPPPPVKWENLEQDWQPAQEDMISGTSGIELRFLSEDGKLQGIPGIHVLVKKRPPPRQFFGGVDADTMFYATQPVLAEPYESFGYLGADRNRCRYGVSNAVGQVRLEGLPAGPIKIEILVPTSNFEQSGKKWSLFFKTEDGLRIADRSDPNGVPTDKAPYMVELEEGKVTKYPLMYVPSNITSEVQDWQSVDKDFVLKWTSPRHNEYDYYRVKLTLSTLMQHPDIVQMSPKLAMQMEEVRGQQWPLGAKGVGELKIAPGNIYLLEVEAVQDEKVVSRLPLRRLWMPWENRETKPPTVGMASDGPAFYTDIWLRTNANGKSLEERLPKLIENDASAFETEYYRLGMAWLDLHKEKPNAIPDLKRLVRELPAGNVARATALYLVQLHESGKQNPKRLNFVAPGVSD
ncbi:MAG: hypothetical protein AAF483_27725, partial [Planctomycetota bacterium]